MRRKILGLILLILAARYVSEDHTPKVWELSGPIWVFDWHEQDTVEQPRYCFVKRWIDQPDIQSGWACDPPPKTAAEAMALRGSF